MTEQTPGDEVPVAHAVESLKPLGVRVARQITIGGGYRSVRWYVPGWRHGSGQDLDGALVLAPGLQGQGDALGPVLRELAAAGARAVIVGQEVPAPGDLGMCLLTAPEELDWAEAFAAVDLLLLDSRNADVADHDDITRFANALAMTCRGHVVVGDRMRRLIGWSSIGDVDLLRRESLVSRMTPDAMAAQMRQDGSWQRLASGEITEYYGSPEDGSRLRLGVVVRVGSEVLGLLSVLPDKDADIEQVKEGLRWGATAAVPYLVRHLARQTVTRPSSVRPLLEGCGVSAHTLARLGMSRSSDFAVAALAAAAPRGITPVNILSRLDLHIEARNAAAGTALIDEIVYVLVGAEGSGAVAAARRLVGNVVEEFRHQGVTVFGALSGPVSGLSGVQVAREQADLVLGAVHEDPTRGPIADLAAMRGAVVIDRLRGLTADVEWLFEGAVAELARHDRATGGELLLTFEAWLRHGRSGRAAARALGLHPSSLTARLERIWQVTRIDPDDYEGLLVAELELAVARAGRLRHGGSSRHIPSFSGRPAPTDGGPYPGT